MRLSSSNPFFKMLVLFAGATGASTFLSLSVLAANVQAASLQPALAAGNLVAKGDGSGGHGDGGHSSGGSSANFEHDGSRASRDGNSSNGHSAASERDGSRSSSTNGRDGNHSSHSDSSNNHNSSNTFEHGNGGAAGNAPSDSRVNDSEEGARVRLEEQYPRHRDTKNQTANPSDQRQANQNRAIDRDRESAGNHDDSFWGSIGQQRDGLNNDCHYYNPYNPYDSCPNTDRPAE